MLKISLLEEIHTFHGQITRGLVGLRMRHLQGIVFI